MALARGNPDPGVLVGERWRHKNPSRLPNLQTFPAPALVLPPPPPDRPHTARTRTVPRVVVLVKVWDPRPFRDATAELHAAEAAAEEARRSWQEAQDAGKDHGYWRMKDHGAAVERLERAENVLRDLLAKVPLGHDPYVPRIVFHQTVRHVEKRIVPLRVLVAEKVARDREHERRRIEREETEAAAELAAELHKAEHARRAAVEAERKRTAAKRTATRKAADAVVWNQPTWQSLESLGLA